MNKSRKGRSYRRRVADINAIYDRHAHSGLSNREVYLRYIYPIYEISERTFYNILKAPVELPATNIDDRQMTLFDNGNNSSNGN